MLGIARRFEAEEQEGKREHHAGIAAHSMCSNRLSFRAAELPQVDLLRDDKGGTSPLIHPVPDVMYVAFGSKLPDH